MVFIICTSFHDCIRHIGITYTKMRLSFLTFCHNHAGNKLTVKEFLYFIICLKSLNSKWLSTASLTYYLYYVSINYI